MKYFTVTTNGFTVRDWEVSDTLPEKSRKFSENPEAWKTPKDAMGFCEVSVINKNIADCFGCEYLSIFEIFELCAKLYKEYITTK